MPPQLPFFRIECVAPGTAHFEELLTLHKKKKARLGPFPRGAFEEHAADDLILGAFDQNNRLAGYLLYRRSRSRASIVHLTRYDEYAGMGVTRSLVRSVLERTRNLSGVGLYCRQDYRLDRMWQSLSFTIRATKIGRGRDGAILDYWWFDHGHEDLFAIAARAEDCTRTTVAIDANVFYDLVYPERPNHDDTGVLAADWIQESVELCVTRELFNEIARCEARETQEKSRRAASSYRELKVLPTELDPVIERLRPLFSSLESPRDVSDMKQLAHTIAAGVPFLVTRDEPMLAMRERVLELFPVELIHPTSLVNQLDALQRSAAYRPALLEGSAWQRKLVVAADVHALVATFKVPTERKSEFESRLRGYLAHPDLSQLFVIKDPTGRDAVVGAITTSHDSSREVTLLRRSDQAAAPTIVRHVLHEICNNLSSETSTHIVVSETCLSQDTYDSLESLGFLPFEDCWHKLSVLGLRSISEAQAIVEGSTMPPSLAERLCALEHTEETRRSLEQRLSPLKIPSSESNAFVVSIRKGWAEQLFAMSFDGQALLATDDRLLIGIEGVYYCSANNKHLRAPSRVLWYVSQGPDGKGPMSVVACSQMEELAIGPPKKIFAQFRNLGVYSWSQVFETAGRTLNESLLAFRFVRTERFRTPVARGTLEALGIPQPQSPRKISDEQFASIYRLGMNLSTK